MSRKIILVLMSLALLSLGGCGNSNEKLADSNNEEVIESNDITNDTTLDDKEKIKEIDNDRVEVSKEEIKDIINKYINKTEKVIEENGFDASIYSTGYNGYCENNWVSGGADSEVDFGTQSVELYYSQTENGFVRGTLSILYNINLQEVKNGRAIDVSDMKIDEYINVFLENYDVDYNDLNQIINEKFKDLSDGTEDNAKYTLDLEDKYSIKFDMYDNCIYIDIYTPPYIVK